jgi:hypothetical protein
MLRMSRAFVLWLRCRYAMLLTWHWYIPATKYGVEYPHVYASRNGSI